MACVLSVGALGCRGPSKDPGSRDLATATSSQANIIIYLVDTLRADHLGIYGYSHNTSPVLDRWATEAVIFDRAYAPCSWTKPSVVSLLSGRDAIGHGVEDRFDVIPADVQLLSERLKARGYSTFAAVTNPNVLPHWGFGRGFDVFEDLDSVGHGTRADAVSDFVAKTVGQLARSQPFFLYLHVLDPHAPFDPPAPYDTRFPRTPAFPEKLSIGRYDGEIAFVDTQFGRVLESVKAQGLYANTMTIFVADHGEELMDHGSFGHGGSLFDEVVRIPLVIRFPNGLHAGRRVSALASLIDVVPTVMSVLGQSAPPGLDGHDLTDLLDGSEPPWLNRELFLSLRTSGPDSGLVRGVLSGPHKYLRETRPNASESLFDIKRDPWETEDIARAEPAVLKRLAGTLDAYLGSMSRGIHLRLMSDPEGEPAGCEALLTTTGRFVDVSGVRLEAADGFELSDDGQRLRLHSRLENRIQSTQAGPRRVPDEDGLVFLVTPPDADIVVQHLRFADGGKLPLRAGSSRSLEVTPFTFAATEAAWLVRDVAEILVDATEAPERATATGYVGVVPAAENRDEPPAELVERLRALGYVSGPTRVE